MLPPWPASTSARSSATSRGCARELAAGAVLCAVVKADGYGHGAMPAARAALAGGATLAGGRHRRSRRARCAPAGVDAPLLVMGALSAEELTIALARRRRRRRLARGLRRARSLGARAAAACTSSSTPAWAGWARATRPRRRGRRGRGGAASCELAGADDALRHRRRARRRVLRRAARALPRVGARRCAERLPASLLHAANSAATLRDARPRTSTWSAAASRSTGWTRSARTRRARARAGAGAALATSPRSSRARRGRAPATGGASSPTRDTRIATRADRLRRRLCGAR